jgi:hypothetical protein
MRPQLYHRPQARQSFAFLERAAFNDPGTRARYLLLVRAARAALPPWARQIAAIELLPLEDVLIAGAADLVGRVLDWGSGEPLPLLGARPRCAAKAKERRRIRDSTPLASRFRCVLDPRTPTAYIQVVEILGSRQQFRLRFRQLPV